jgi:hypothetical protein
MADAKITTDHDQIRKWAEERGGRPAVVRSTRRKGSIGILRLEFPDAPNANDEALEEISWEEFFEKFDESDLALLYQQKTARGQKSNFNKLIGRETAEARAHGDRHASRNQHSGDLMPTNAKSKTKKTAERKARGGESKSKPRNAKSGGPDALDLLEQDHREVQGYFDKYEDLEDDAEKGELAQKICLALRVHAQLEEEIFYPAARKATKDNDLLDEATVEHAGAKNLIAEIEEMNPGDALYDAKVKVLGDQVRHHVEEEESELFPECEAAKMDLDALGAQMTKRKAELLKQPA